MNKDLLQEKLRALAKRVEPYKKHLVTEEGTKTSVVLPFIHEILGYDVFNPAEVRPEFVADVGVKKGEKVDYAIFGPEGCRMLIECKALSVPLKSVHVSQLFRYFAVSPAKVGILTNGDEFRFYTDSEKPNLLDSKPFLAFSLGDVSSSDVETLLSMTNSDYNFESISSSLSLSKYEDKLNKIIKRVFSDTPDEWVGAFVAEVYDGPNTFKIRQEFKPIVMKALNAFLEENQKPVKAEKVEKSVSGAGIVTTPEELKAYGIVQDMLSDMVAPSRIKFRDTRSYFAIYLDDGTKHGKLITSLYIVEGKRYAVEMKQRDGKYRAVNVGSLSGIESQRDLIREKLSQLLEDEKVAKEKKLAEAANG